MRNLVVGAVALIIAALLLLVRFGIVGAGDDLPDTITKRCENSTVYGPGKIPQEPGDGEDYQTYPISLPADIQACAATVRVNDITYYGFDQVSQCQNGYCVSGLATFDATVKFWFEDPASVPPTEVEIWYRKRIPGETNPITPTPTATLPPEHVSPIVTPTPTPTAIVGPPPSFPTPVDYPNDIYLPAVMNNSN